MSAGVSQISAGEPLFSEHDSIFCDDGDGDGDGSLIDGGDGEPAAKMEGENEEEEEEEEEQQEEEAEEEDDVNVVEALAAAVDDHVRAFFTLFLFVGVSRVV